MIFIFTSYHLISILYIRPTVCLFVSWECCSANVKQTLKLMTSNSRMCSVSRLDFDNLRLTPSLGWCQFCLRASQASRLAPRCMIQLTQTSSHWHFDGVSYCIPSASHLRQIVVSSRAFLVLNIAKLCACFSCKSFKFDVTSFIIFYCSLYRSKMRKANYYDR